GGAASYGGLPLIGNTVNGLTSGMNSGLIAPHH
ncbi:Nuclear pore complex protein-Nup96 precursor, partial [Erwinia amylovora]